MAVVTYLKNTADIAANEVCIVGVDGDAFVYNKEYENGSNEKLKFNNVQYYISNIKLEKVDGTVWSEPESYHLIDNAVSSSMMFQIKDLRKIMRRLILLLLL